MSRNQHYDADDLDYDEYYEEDYGGEYDDIPAAKPKSTLPKASGKLASGTSRVGARGRGKGKGSSTTTASAATAGASSLAQYLCDSPQLKPNGNRHKGVKKSSKNEFSQPFPISPSEPGGIERFKFDEPSPDDVVVGLRTKGNQVSSGLNSMEPIAKAVDQMTLGTSEPSEPNEGNNSVAPGPPSRRDLSEYIMETDLVRLCNESRAEDNGGRTKLHLVILGHVDAGKSTLMGRLLYELGMLGQKEVHKNERESAQAGKASFSWAWALDERQEERERGVTVDVAMSRFQTSKYQVTLLDAPGHRDFIPNMISGTAQADAALLVVDGSASGFEAGFQVSNSVAGGGQTREHAQLARTLGLEQIAVVITKLDTCDFSQERFEEVKGLLLPFLLKCGFREGSIQWLPASAPDGMNLTTLPPEDSKLATWWKGSTVVDAINAFESVDRNFGTPLRMPISDVLRTRSLGQSGVGGKVEGGALKQGGKVLVMPCGEIATIKAIEVDGKTAQLGRAGDSCDVGLSDIDAAHLFPGAVLCTPGWPVCTAVHFVLRTLILEPRVPIIPGQQVALHAHAAREEGRVSKLVSILNPKTGEVLKNRPRCLVKGQTAVIEINAMRGICLEEYSRCRALGRVALRESGRTVAVGIVTEIRE